MLTLIVIFVLIKMGIDQRKEEKPAEVADYDDWHNEQTH